jgi:hypothetical protein
MARSERIRRSPFDIMRAVLTASSVPTVGCEATCRYAWPAELDLMARLPGLRLRDRLDYRPEKPFDHESAPTSPCGRNWT